MMMIKMKGMMMSIEKKMMLAMIDKPMMMMLMKLYAMVNKDDGDEQTMMVILRDECDCCPLPLTAIGVAAAAVAAVLAVTVALSAVPAAAVDAITAGLGPVPRRRTPRLLNSLAGWQRVGAGLCGAYVCAPTCLPAHLLTCLPATHMCAQVPAPRAHALPPHMQARVCAPRHA